MPYAHKLEKQAKAKGITVRKLIEDMLAAKGGNKYQAAIALEVYPNALTHHLSKPVQDEALVEPVAVSAV